MIDRDISVNERRAVAEDVGIKINERKSSEHRECSLKVRIIIHHCNPASSIVREGGCAHVHIIDSPRGGRVVIVATGLIKSFLA